MKAHVKRYAYKRKVGTPQILYYFIGHKLELCTQKKRDMERQKERRGKRRQSTRLKMLQILQQQQKKSQRKERKIQAIFVFGSRYETRT